MIFGQISGRILVLDFFWKPIFSQIKFSFVKFQNQDYFCNFENSGKLYIVKYTSEESKKGRTKVVGPKSSRNSYFSKSRFIFWLSDLCHLSFTQNRSFFQKLEG